MVEKQTYTVAYLVGLSLQLYQTHLLVVLPIYPHPRDRFDTDTPIFAPRGDVPIIPVQIDNDCFDFISRKRKKRMAGYYTYQVHTYTHLRFNACFRFRSVHVQTWQLRKWTWDTRSRRASGATMSFLLSTSYSFIHSFIHLFIHSSSRPHIRLVLTINHHFHHLIK
jgi:hypothetical protein